MLDLTRAFDDGQPTVVELVETYLAHDFFLETALKRRILNIRQTARWMIEACSWDATEEAVVSALRRYEPLERTGIEAGYQTLAETTFRGGTGLALLRVPQELAYKLKDVYEACPHEEDVSVFPGNRTIRVVVPEHYAQEAKTILEGSARHEIKAQPGVAQLEIQFPSDDPIATLATATLLHLIGLYDIDPLETHTYEEGIWIAFAQEEWVDASRIISSCIQAAKAWEENERGRGEAH